MTRLLKQIQTNALLIIILVFAIIIRLAFINEIPPGIANDEINIIINAQSILKTGQNIPGVVTGILGHPKGDLGAGIHSEISSLLIIPSIALLGLQWPVAKIPFIIASLGVVYASYLLIKKLVNKEAALLAAFLAAINPWSILFARSAYESIFSAFFYLLAIYIIFHFQSWKILWSVPFFIMGLLSYFSAKTLMIPIALVMLLGIKLMGPKKSFKPILAVNIILLIFVIAYFPLLSKSPAGTRFNELKSSTTTDLVNLKRTQSLESPLVTIYENKITEDLRTRFHASLGVISANFLFINGQPENIPSLTINNQGPLYLIDLLLIVFGFIFLVKTNTRLFITLLGLITITLIPNFLNLQGSTYMIRTVILFPILTMISAVGLYYIKKTVSKNLHYLYIPFLIIYLIFFGNFIYEYFHRLPIDKNEGWFLHDRIVSRYIEASLKQNNLNITLVSATPKQTFYRYLFFNNLYKDPLTIQKINNDIAQGNYKINGLTVTEDCPIGTPENLIINTAIPCSEGLKGSAISSLRDGRAIYVIINDKLCQDFVSRRYPLIKNISELNIEGLSREDFCQKYITNILF